MLYQPPEETLSMVRLRQAEIRKDAAEARRTRRNQSQESPIGRVSGLQLHVGRLLIVVGRTLREEESPCPDLIRS
jgi:hypothetical protein